MVKKLIGWAVLMYTLAFAAAVLGDVTSGEILYGVAGGLVVVSVTSMFKAVDHWSDQRRLRGG